MRLYNLFRQPDFSQGIKEYQNAPGAVLLDVRTPQEYKEGHVPGSINIPLSAIRQAADLAINKDASFFVYCHSGVKSRQAVSALQKMGFRKVKNIGGIAAYRGRVVK